MMKIVHMQEKNVGYQTVWKVSSEKYPSTNLWLASIADKQAYFNHCKHKVNDNPPKGVELVEINYSEYMHWYIFGHHSVENNNKNNQGCLSFEGAFTPDF